MKPSFLSATARVVAFAVPALLVTGCGESEIPQSPLEVARYERVNEQDAAVLSFAKVDSILLGNPESGVYGITDLEIHDDNLYVVDEMAKAVHVFDRTGAPLRRLGRPGSGPGEFKMPVSVAFGPRGVLVVDPSHGRQVSVFGVGGSFVRKAELDIPTNPVAIASAGERMVGMGVLGITDPARQGWNVLGVTDADGSRVGEGCVIDVRYVESSRRKGMVSHFDFGSVAARGDRIYCTQAISPVVQVMDLAGKPVEQIRMAPPFYTPPEDREATLNQKSIFEFLGSFTSHSGFYPVEGGFVSVYSRFDEDVGEVRYHLFACSTGGTTRCGVVRNIRKPVYVESLDTIYLEEEVQPNAPVQVGVYRMGRPRAAE